MPYPEVQQQDLCMYVAAGWCRLYLDADIFIVLVSFFGVFCGGFLASWLVKKTDKRGFRKGFP